MPTMWNLLWKKIELILPNKIKNQKFITSTQQNLAKRYQAFLAVKQTQPFNQSFSGVIKRYIKSVVWSISFRLPLQYDSFVSKHYKLTMQIWTCSITYQGQIISKASRNQMGSPALRYITNRFLQLHSTSLHLLSHDSPTRPPSARRTRRVLSGRRREFGLCWPEFRAQTRHRPLVWTRNTSISFQNSTQTTNIKKKHKFIFYRNQ